MCDNWNNAGAAFTQAGCGQTAPPINGGIGYQLMTPFQNISSGGICGEACTPINASISQATCTSLLVGSNYTARQASCQSTGQCTYAPTSPVNCNAADCCNGACSPLSPLAPHAHSAIALAKVAKRRWGRRSRWLLERELHGRQHHMRGRPGSPG
jgi:hypothetical protein